MNWQLKHTYSETFINLSVNCLLTSDSQDVTKDAVEDDNVQHVPKVVGSATKKDLLIIIKGKEVLHD